MGEQLNDLQERLLKFAVDVILTLRKLEDSIENRVIKHQLIRSSGSVGANYEEAQAASSRADFINKVKISLKESRESNYWLRILAAVNKENSAQPALIDLIRESTELKKILGAIASRTTK